MASTTLAVAAALSSQAVANSYKPHPIAGIVPGEMSAEEFKALKSDIKKHGQQNPVLLYKGQILDGRARARACEELGLSLLTADMGDITDAQARQTVLSYNLHRRTLTSMQKAMVAARQHIDIPDYTQQQAADDFGVSITTLNVAVQLLKSKNTPLILRTQRGDATRAEVHEALVDAGLIRSNVRNFEEKEPTQQEIDELFGGANGGDNKKKTTGKAAPRPDKNLVDTVVQELNTLAEPQRVIVVRRAWGIISAAARAAKLKL